MIIMLKDDILLVIVLNCKNKVSTELIVCNYDGSFQKIKIIQILQNDISL